jgi:hypothetical protein
MDVSQFKCRVLPHKDDDTTAKTFRHEGYDMITLKKMVERQYTIPQPQTADEVIGYYARRIAQDVNVANKDRAAKLRCENTTRLTGKPWDYVKVLQTEHNNLQARQFANLLALGGR